ncbi:MAG: branched-chain amino acid ABC transporter permease [Microthrixaceae bacterium]
MHLLAFDTEFFLQRIFAGFESGAVYAMLGLGLVIIYRSSGLLNFAQGEMAMFSTYLVWALVGGDGGGGMNVWLALVLVMIISFAGAAVIQAAVIRPLGDPHLNPLAVVIVTIGLYLTMHELPALFWDSANHQLTPLFGTGSIDIAGTAFTYRALGAVVLLLVEAAAFWAILRYTKLGLALRAVSTNSESASLSGVAVQRTLMLGWGLAVAIGVVAGVTTVGTQVFDPNFMLVVIIYAFAGVTLGGFDSPLGAVVGGLTVGLITETLPFYVDAIGGEFQLMPAFVLILVVLLVRPQGLFGRREVNRV